jgi:hypothetical protein
MKMICRNYFPDTKKTEEFIKQCLGILLLNRIKCK